MDFQNIKALAAGGGFSSSANLSGFSACMLLAIMQRLSIRENWREMTDDEWDECDNLVSQAMSEVMENTMVGVVLPTLADEIPGNMLECNGQVVTIYDYPELADACPSLVVGTTINVPDMRDKFIMGSDVSGSIGGANSMTLSVGNIPAHTHNYQQYTFGVDIESVGVPDPTGVGQPSLTRTTSSAGNGEAFDNRPSYYTVRYAIVAR